MIDCVCVCVSLAGVARDAEGQDPRGRGGGLVPDAGHHATHEPAAAERQ